jgi:hypothetical protein
MVPLERSTEKEGLGFYSELIQSCTNLHELTGKVGDVILLHPLMVHSATKNGKRLRIITSPPVALRAPFNFDRRDESDYSVVQLETIKEIGADNLKGWRMTGKREKIVPERAKIQAHMRKEEQRRLQEEIAPAPREKSVAA